MILNVFLLILLFVSITIFLYNDFKKNFNIKKEVQELETKIQIETYKTCYLQGYYDALAQKPFDTESCINNMLKYDKNENMFSLDSKKKIHKYLKSEIKKINSLKQRKKRK